MNKINLENEMRTKLLDQRNDIGQREQSSDPNGADHLQLFRIPVSGTGNILLSINAF